MTTPAGRTSPTDTLNALKHAFQNGQIWTKEVIDPTFGASGISIAFDQDGNPGVAYHDTFDYGQHFGYWAGDTWSREVVDRRNHSESPRALAFDPTGHPAIAFSNSYDRSMHYAFKTADTWLVETVDAGKGWGASLAFDSAGNPAITYVHADNSEIRYARRIGGQWSIQAVNGPPGAYPSLALDSEGRPIIAYSASPYIFPDPRHSVTVARWTGQEWQVDTLSTNARGASNLALGRGGNLMVTYVEWDAQGQGDLIFAERIGQEWLIETVESGHDIGESHDLAVDEQGRPYISYADFTVGAIRLATQTGAMSTGTGRFTTFLPALMR